VTALAFLVGLALGVVLGVLLWPFLVISKEPPRYVEPYDYSVTGI
jgi:hypothetical protein